LWDARKRGVESFEKREKDAKRGQKIKRKVCVWKRKKKNNNKYMCMRE
jgi:hypothetical protein